MWAVFKLAINVFVVAVSLGVFVKQSGCLLQIMSEKQEHRCADLSPFFCGFFVLSRSCKDSTVLQVCGASCGCQSPKNKDKDTQDVISLHWDNGSTPGPAVPVKTSFNDRKPQNTYIAAELTVKPQRFKKRRVTQPNTEEKGSTDCRDASSSPKHHPGGIIPWNPCFSVRVPPKNPVLSNYVDTLRSVSANKSPILSSLIAPILSLVPGAFKSSSPGNSNRPMVLSPSLINLAKPRSTSQVSSEGQNGSGIGSGTGSDSKSSGWSSLVSLHNRSDSLLKLPDLLSKAPVVYNVIQNYVEENIIPMQKQVQTGAIAKAINDSLMHRNRLAESLLNDVATPTQYRSTDLSRCLKSKELQNQLPDTESKDALSESNKSEEINSQSNQRGINSQSNQRGINSQENQRGINSQSYQRESEEDNQSELTQPDKRERNWMRFHTRPIKTDDVVSLFRFHEHWQSNATLRSEWKRFYVSRQSNLTSQEIDDVMRLNASRPLIEVLRDATINSPLILDSEDASAPGILNPYVSSPYILSPYIFGPFILSPLVLTPQILSPSILSPSVLTPYVLSPIILSPGVLNPSVLSPFVLSPIILSPAVLGPLVLSPEVLSPCILSPAVLSPVVISPMVLSPAVMCPSILSPTDDLSPGVLS